MTALVSCCSPCGVPHLARGADHGRHRGVDDDVARDVEVGDARSESTMARCGAGGRWPWRCRPRSRSARCRRASPMRASRSPSRCWGRRRGDRRSRRGGRTRRRRRPDGVAEDDRVGDLHHRGLEVQREQHARAAGVGDLLGEERAEGPHAHEGGVDDLAGQHGEARRRARSRRRRCRSARCGRRPARATVTDCSLERKSPADMVATWVLESGDQAPIEWGWLRAYAFTDAGARRSELPSRSTGLTALPLTLS